jgi:dynactin-5
VVAGKCLIESDVMLRGDLRRAGVGQAVSISLGRNCILRQGCLIRPPYKTFKGIFSYYPVKIGDNVYIGKDSIVQAAAIGSNVRIGYNCILVGSS